MSAKPKQSKNPKPQPGAAQPATIGVATMAEDGTITLLLRAESPAGALGDAVLTYKKSDPNYASILKHVGALKPGEQKPVAPFP
jgi:hypothetical protein